MKALKVFGICALLAVSGQSFANTVPIKFVKGSYCGSFSGNVAGKKFTLQLGVNQVLNINIPYEDAVPTVKDPKGRNLELVDYIETQYLFDTTIKGQYTVVLKPLNPKNPNVSVEFCALNL